jgi:hypothetical protein
MNIAVLRIGALNSRSWSWSSPGSWYWSGSRSGSY